MSRFSAPERTALLALKGVGPTVVSRLEALGYCRLDQLRGEAASVITLRIARLIGAPCWHNSPQARAAIAAVIDLAENPPLS